VTDRPTDHTTRSVTIGRIYVRSTAMWHEDSEAVLKNNNVFESIFLGRIAVLRT